MQNLTALAVSKKILAACIHPGLGGASDRTLEFNFSAGINPGGIRIRASTGGVRSVTRSTKRRS